MPRKATRIEPPVQRMSGVVTTEVLCQSSSTVSGASHVFWGFMRTMKLLHCSIFIDGQLVSMRGFAIHLSLCHGESSLSQLIENVGIFNLIAWSTKCRERYENGLAKYHTLMLIDLDCCERYNFMRGDCEARYFKAEEVTYFRN